MRSFGLALVGGLALCLSSCGPSQYKDAIIGKWQSTTPGNNLTLEFFSDGKGKIAGFDMTYRLDSSNNCHITTKQPLKEGKTNFRTKVSISGDVMTITDPDGSNLTLQRVKPPEGTRDQPGKQGTPTKKPDNPWIKPGSN
jgi:hypothetical protein